MRREDITSLGLATDVMIAAAGSQVIPRPDCLVIRTPDNPSYYWGNFLVFPQAPKSGSAAAWTARFHDEFADMPDVRHVAIAWDGQQPGEHDELVAAGFDVTAEDTLVASRVAYVPPPRVEAELRELVSDDDWRQAVENQVACREDGHDEVAYRQFKEPEFEQYRRLADAGRGAWFGAFVDGRLVADLGLFHDEGERGIGRYQSVGTHPDFRRRGLCRALVAAAGRRALASWGVRQLVIVADSGSAAAAIYRSVGFGLHEQYWSAQRKPESG